MDRGEWRRGTDIFSFSFCSLWPHRMQDLGSLARAQTHVPCSGSIESQPLNHQGRGVFFSVLVSC